MNLRYDILNVIFQFSFYVSHSCGERAYVFADRVAELEKALVRFTLDQLRNEGFVLPNFVTLDIFHLILGFKVIIVPDILPVTVPRACGLMQRSDHDILYHVNDRFCLSGTGEMGIADYLGEFLGFMFTKLV